MAPTLDELFERRVTFPNADSKERFDRLVGLDHHKRRLEKMLGILTNPRGLLLWADQYHPHAQELINITMKRPPLVVLSGDVGTGKTEIAETIGDSVARHEEIDITLFPLSLSTRGQGLVGEMTHLLSAAFDHVIAEARKLKGSSYRSRGAVILLVDEADALAQSREAAQMHHEDRAGVNAFIRGIDRAMSSKCPLAIILCTNRVSSLDPAVRRRAADILVFSRPDKSQRYELLSRYLKQLPLPDSAIRDLVEATGERRANGYGFTFSDLVQRLLPAIVLDAYPTQSVVPSRALEIARKLLPTAPFEELGS